MTKPMTRLPMLLNDGTTPGIQITPELQKLIPIIVEKVKSLGLDFYPPVVQMLTYSEISEVAAYGGFPVRYPHWQWGMEYEELQRGYEHGNYKIYEMVINSNPCVIYCLDSNTLVDNVTVIAHALGHNDFFKNNVFFSITNQNMINGLANNGTRVRRYMARWGKERVIEFIDHCLRINTLIDPSKAWDVKEYKDPVVFDTRRYHHPVRLDVKEGHDYMDAYLNPEKWIEEQKEVIRKKEIAEYLELFEEPTRDIMGFIRDFANLKPWQADILSMLYEESAYFYPQRITKTINEGWASWTDFNVMAKGGFAALGQEGDDHGIIDYAIHRMGVLGGKYSMNPYKLGFCLLQDIEERWDKGCFGYEYDHCDDYETRKNWDKKLGLGHEKILEVRKYYNDFMLISEFFTEDFCNKYEFFEWQRYPNGEYKIVSRDYSKIKNKLIKSCVNGGLPDIRLVDPNFRNKGEIMLKHYWEGRVLHAPYATEVLKSLYYLWKKPVHLMSKSRDEQNVVISCEGSDVKFRTQKEFEKGPVNE